MRGNWQYALLAFLLALVAWYFVSGREKVDVWMQASVQFSAMPDNLVIRDGLLRKINVRVRGPKGLVHNLEDRSLVYSLDLAKLKPGLNVFPIEPDKFPLSKTFEVVEINPSRLEITVDRLSSKQVPVKPVWEGTLDPDYQLMEVMTQPSSVVIKGPQKIIDEIQQVPTQVIALPSATPGLIEEVVPLSLPDEIEAGTGFVDVRLLFGVKTKAFTLELPLSIENKTKYKASVKPQSITVEMEIPLPVARQGDIKDAVSAKVVADEYMGPGYFAVAPLIMAPKGGRLLKVTPEYVELGLSEE